MSDKAKITNIIEELYKNIARTGKCWEDIVKEASTQATNHKDNLLTKKESLEEYLTTDGTVEEAMTLTELANVYGKLGDILKKKELLEKALAIASNYYHSREHREVIEILNNLAMTLNELGDHNKAKELLKEIAISTNKYYNKQQTISTGIVANIGMFFNSRWYTRLTTIYYDLANVYGELGEPLKKKELLEKVLNMAINHWNSRDNIDVAQALNNLAISYGELGDFNQAKELLAEALTIQIKQYSISHGTWEHIDTAITLYNLAIIYGELGDICKEKKLLEKTLAIALKHYKTLEHIEIAKILESLGIAEGKLGNPLKEKALLEKVLAIRKNHYQNFNHQSIAITMANLAQAYSSSNEFQQALPLIDDAYQILLTQPQYDANYPSIKLKQILTIKEEIEQASLAVASTVWLHFKLEKLKQNPNSNSVPSRPVIFSPFFRQLHIFGNLKNTLNITYAHGPTANIFSTPMVHGHHIGRHSCPPYRHRTIRSYAVPKVRIGVPKPTNAIWLVQTLKYIKP